MKGSAISNIIHYLEVSGGIDKLDTTLDFIDEVSKAILEGREYRYADPIRRAELLQEVIDLEAIITRYGEAEDYTIEPHRRGKNPAMIIFQYAPDEENPEGTTEEYPLEMSSREKKEAIGKGAEALKESVKKDEAAEARARRKFKEMAKRQQKLDEEIVKKIEDYLMSVETMMSVDTKEEREWEENATEQELDSYHKLEKITTYLPDEVMKDLSEPLAMLAEAEHYEEAEGKVDEIMENFLAKEEDYIEGLDDEQFEDFLDEIIGITDEFDLG